LKFTSADASTRGQGSEKKKAGRQTESGKNKTMRKRKRRENERVRKRESERERENITKKNMQILNSLVSVTEKAMNENNDIIFFKEGERERFRERDKMRE